jgi:phosphoglycerate dehydrogenase-like enzyme
LADVVEVLVMAPNLGDDLDYIRAVDARVRVTDGNAAFLAEVAEQHIWSGLSWEAPADPPSRAERDAMLERAEVLVVGFPVPRDLVSRAPRLRWVHHTQAGVSNLYGTDMWDSSVVLSSSRGHVAVTAIAEYVLAGALLFARGLHESERQRQAGRFTREGYALSPMRGATMGIVGLGGIGREVARLSRAIGMRIVATTRTAQQRAADVDGVDLLLPAARIVELAEQSDVVALCAQLTVDNDGLIDEHVLAAMRPSTVLVNVARGELLDEAALIAALRDGRLGGAVLDVYRGEMAGRPPQAALLELPQVLLTPHISSMGDAWHEPVKQLFAANLRRFIDSEPLVNVVDRARGY